MDAYSFGMLCLWLIFFSTEGNKNGSIRDAIQKDDLREVANRLLIADTNLDEYAKSKLRQLFQCTLPGNPFDRNPDFIGFTDLLSRWQ